MDQADVIIIGAGVSGLMSARELALAGAKVLVLERQALAKESSWAGGGILSPLNPWKVAEPITTLCAWSQAVYPKLAQELEERTGIAPEWRQSGLLFAECEALDIASPWAKAHACRHETLPSEAVRQSEPNLRAFAGQSLLLPDIGQVRNPRLLRALREDLTRLGVALLEHHPVEAIQTQQGRIVSLVSQGKSFTAETYVLAAGAWTGLLANETGVKGLPIAPVKGEMLIFDAPPGLLGHMVLNQGRYLIPRLDGKILAGSTVENAQFNKATTTMAHETLRAFALNLLPALRKYPIEKHWAGLRPGSPDGIPSIGPHPELANLHINSGHFRNGFVMAPASARLLADHILRRPPSVPPAPYLPRAVN